MLLDRQAGGHGSGRLSTIRLSGANDILIPPTMLNIFQFPKSNHHRQFSGSESEASCTRTPIAHPSHHSMIRRTHRLVKAFRTGTSICQMAGRVVDHVHPTRWWHTHAHPSMKAVMIEHPPHPEGCREWTIVGWL